MDLRIVLLPPGEGGPKGRMRDLDFSLNSPLVKTLVKRSGSFDGGSNAN